LVQGLGMLVAFQPVQVHGSSLHFGGEGALLTALLLQRDQEPSGCEGGRFSASKGAEGGVHRPFRCPSGHLCLFYQPGVCIATAPRSIHRRAWKAHSPKSECKIWDTWHARGQGSARSGFLTLQVHHKMWWRCIEIRPAARRWRRGGPSGYPITPADALPRRAPLVPAPWQRSGGVSGAPQSAPAQA